MMALVVISLMYSHLVTDFDVSLPPVIRVLYSRELTPNPVDVTEYSLPWWKSGEGNQFEYHREQWRFNLLFTSFSAPGTYTVSVQPGSDYLIEPTCTGTFVVEDRLF